MLLLCPPRAAVVVLLAVLAATAMVFAVQVAVSESGRGEGRVLTPVLAVLW